MALSATEQLWNESLGLLGQYEVTEGQTSTQQYILCNRFYVSARNEVLALHPWNEAITQALVLQDATAPLFEFNYKYALPTDCLRVLSIDEDIQHWEVQGGYVVTSKRVMPDQYQVGNEYEAGQYLSYNSVTYLIDTGFTATAWATDVANLTSQTGDYGYVKMTYIRQLTDPADFSVKLRGAIVHKLAIKIATSITNNPKVKLDLVNEFERLVMPQARSVDAMQGRIKTNYNSEWLRARR